ncbi:hypothetical protein DdX_17771 [Ditylenchus destructor]|uniref:Uncharacterized protein n=1 Tax=Ditylenchus destructor TaxID=166010 RepID=A0AAD4ML45_9BILA|nr:hypothetical protein DdX_17771 [Ditylenchus destructor]
MQLLMHSNYFPGCVILLLFWVGSFDLASSQCPRMHGKKTSASKNSKDSSDEGGKPPGAKPVKHYIQTTFIFRDLSDDDRTFSHICMEKLHNLRPRLKSHAQVTIDNENIDCSVHHFAQCREYPLKTSYHFLVVEDSVHGAAVYSLDRKHNTNSNAVEMAILDALSRHSLHPLVGYASKEATNEVGFVREVRPAELEKFAEENMKDLRERSKSSPSTIFTYSPYELRLLNQRILELRRHDFDTQSVQSLKQFRGGELLEAIDSGKMVLVLFWTNAQSVSSHAFELWARVADAWRQKYEARNDPELILGSVACQDQTDVCTAFAISHQNQHTIYAYNDGKLIASQVYMGEESFYLQWLDIIVNTKALKALENAEELARAKAGIVPDVPGVRPAVTIGTFSSEESEELRRFKKIAQMLNGRYHLVYIINTKAAPTVITIRPFEPLEKTIEYVGNFDQRSLLTHVTHNSMPSLFDIGNGFTSEIFYPAKQIVLLIFDSILHSELQKEFAIAAGNNAMNNKARDKLFAQIDIQNSVKLDKFMQNLEDSVSCTLKFDANENVEKLISNSDRLKHKVDIGASSVHPLKYIQSEHINRIFGEQDVKLLPEPRLAKQSSVPMHGHQDPHNLEDMDEGAISGCPMMAHMSHTDRADRDEL